VCWVARSCAINVTETTSMCAHVAHQIDCNLTDWNMLMTIADQNTIFMLSEQRKSAHFPLSDEVQYLLIPSNDGRFDAKFWSAIFKQLARVSQSIPVIRRFASSIYGYNQCTTPATIDCPCLTSIIIHGRDAEQCRINYLARRIGRFLQ
jgi:hypothetical protein